MSQTATNEGVILDTNAAIPAVMCIFKMNIDSEGWPMVTDPAAQNFLERNSSDTSPVINWLLAGHPPVWTTDMVLHEIGKVLRDNKFSDEEAARAVKIWEDFVGERKPCDGIVHGNFSGHQPLGSIGENLGKPDFTILAASHQSGFPVLTADQGMAWFTKMNDGNYGTAILIKGT